jgi:hypothetical protein
MRAGLNCISRALRSSAGMVEKPHLILDYIKYRNAAAKACIMSDDGEVCVDASNHPSFRHGAKKVSYHKWREETRNETFERARYMLVYAGAFVCGVVTINSQSKDRWACATSVVLHTGVFSIAGAVLGYYAHFALPVVMFSTGVTLVWRTLRAVRQYKK